MNEIFEQIPRELIDAFHQASLAVVENGHQIEMLSDKAGRIQRAIPRLEDDMAAAESIKAGILARYAVDKATADELDQARDAFQKVKSALENEQEVLIAVKKALSEAEGRVSFLNSQKQSARVKIYQCLSALTLAELRNRGQELFFLLDASAKVQGADRAGNPFEGLHPLNSAQRVKQIEAELLGGVQ